MTMLGLVLALAMGWGQQTPTSGTMIWQRPDCHRQYKHGNSGGYYEVCDGSIVSSTLEGVYGPPPETTAPELPLDAVDCSKMNYQQCIDAGGTPILPTSATIQIMGEPTDEHYRAIAPSDWCILHSDRYGNTACDKDDSGGGAGYLCDSECMSERDAPKPEPIDRSDMEDNSVKTAKFAYCEWKTDTMLICYHMNEADVPITIETKDLPKPSHLSQKGTR